MLRFQKLLRQEAELPTPKLEGKSWSVEEVTPGRGEGYWLPLRPLSVSPQSLTSPYSVAALNY